MPVCLQRVDALPVVGHTDRVDPPQRVLDDVHLDVEGVCIKRVPDEFGQRLDRRRRAQRGDVIFLGLDMNVFHKARASLQHGYVVTIAEKGTDA